MASSRRKLDDKHVKTLRDLAALPANKYCFDCRQRGPTYVNITIGSFVCTKCSGILRGLTPPHRVKSISMATFTPEEVDIIKSKGNQYCQNVWLGLCENEPTTKDELQIKEFMIDKYEKKRYYVEPNKAMERQVNGIPSSQSTPANLDLAFAPPPPPPKKDASSSRSHPSSRFIGEPLAIPPVLPPSQPAPPPPMESSFANFDNNPIFVQPPQPSPLQPASSIPGGKMVVNANVSALTTPQSSQQPPTNGNHDPWGDSSSSSESSPWPPVQQPFASNGIASQTSKGFNPFASQISSSESWGFFNTSAPSVNNPFKDLKQSDWLSNGSGLTSSQSVGSFQWTPSVPNPFSNVRPGVPGSNPFM